MDKATFAMGVVVASVHVRTIAEGVVVKYLSIWCVHTN